MYSRHCCSQGEALGETPTGWESFPPGDTQATELTVHEASPWTHPSSEGGEAQPSRMVDLESHSPLGAAGAGLRVGRGPCLLQAGTEAWEFLQEGRRVPAPLNDCPGQQLSVNQARREGRV